MKRHTVDRSIALFDWHWIWRALLLRKWSMLLILVATLGTYAAALAIPFLSRHAVDAIVSGSDAVHLSLLALIAIISIAAENALSMGRQSVVISLGGHLERRISRHIFVHLLRLRLDGKRLEAGDILSRFQQISKIREFSIFAIPHVIFGMGGAVAALVAMSYYDLPLGIAVLTLAVATGIFLNLPVASLHKMSKHFREAIGKQQGLLSETVHGLDTVKALNLEGAFLSHWTIASNSALSRLCDLLKLDQRVGASTQTSARAMSLLVIGLGGWHVLHGRLSLGQLLALQLLATQVTNPIISGGEAFRSFQEAKAALDSISDFTRQPREHIPPQRYASVASTPMAWPSGDVEREPSSSQGHMIVMHALSYTYPDRSRPALDGVTLALPRTGMVALIGSNGSGKSTLVKIMTGLQRNYEGTVQLSGTDLLDYHPRRLRNKMGVVLQDTVLFSGTIRSNLSFGMPLSDDVLNEALAFAGAVGFVEELPQGLDTELEEGGRGLSGGQRQRLSVARAFVRQPSIVVLDEPTAFLDAQAAVELETRLAQWGKTRLLILVTHHLSAIRHADMIVMMEHGRVIGQGKHDALLSTLTPYRSMWSDYSRSIENKAA